MFLIILSLSSLLTSNLDIGSQPTDTDLHPVVLLNRTLRVLKNLFKALRHREVLELCHSLPLFESQQLTSRLNSST
jgi:hypothetical protein